MTTPIFLTILAFTVLCGATLLWVHRTDRRRQFVQDRLQALTRGVDAGESAPRLAFHRKIRRAASQNPVFRFPIQFKAWLDAALRATGNWIGILHLIAAGLISAIIVVLFARYILVLNTSLVISSAVLAAVGGPGVLLRMAQSRYQNKFLNIFPDALDLVGRSVKAGLPVNEALVVAGREIADPVGMELRQALDQVQIGVPMVDALNQTADRIWVADFRFMVVALALQARTGGSLAETLANLSHVIRARKALRLKARALSAEAKASAAVLAALPFVLGAFMYVMNRDLMMPLFVDPRGRLMVGVAFLSLILGLSTMAVMVKRAIR
jgi:tight adherence protein B